jgi:hypothetical protein
LWKRRYELEQCGQRKRSGGATVGGGRTVEERITVGRGLTMEGGITEGRRGLLRGRGFRV